MVLAHHGRTVAAQRERQRVTVEQRIVGTPHDRSQGGILAVTICLAVKARGSSTEIIVAHRVGNQAGGRSPEARFGVFLILHTHHGLQRMNVPRIQEVGGHVAEPLLGLCLATVHTTVRPCPGGEELVVLVGRITVRTEGRDAQIAVLAVSPLPVDDVVGKSQMGIEVHVLRIIVHLYQRTGGTYLRGIAVFQPFTVLAVIRASRVHGID